jgi:hypothetical protein
MLVMIVLGIFYKIGLNVVFHFSYLLHNYLYIYTVVIMCTFTQLGKYQFKYMNVYIEPLVNDLLNLWVGITMYDISRPIRKRKFQFHGIITWTIHDASGITHFSDM